MRLSNLRITPKLGILVVVAMVGLLGSLPFIRPEAGAGPALAGTGIRSHRNPTQPVVSPPAAQPSAASQAQQQVQLSQSHLQQVLIPIAVLNQDSKQIKSVILVQQV